MPGKTALKKHAVIQGEGRCEGSLTRFISVVWKPVVCEGPVSSRPAVETPEQQENADQQSGPREEEAEGPARRTPGAPHQSHA